VKLKKCGEFGLLNELGLAAIDLPPGWAGPGDDAAVLPAYNSNRSNRLFSTDLMVEGVHFSLEYTPPQALGYKLLAVNVSDIAAMGGSPSAFTVSLAAPADTEVRWIKDFYRGLKEAADEFKCPLVGGDTSSGPCLMFSIAIIGDAPVPGPVLRSGASVGDDLFVSGWPGESALGFKLLSQRFDCKGSRREKLISRHLKPTPRLELGRALGERTLATSMIDVSDGVLKDLSHIIEASNVGAEIWAESLPLSEELRQEAEALGLNGEDIFLTGGEDYELLFTANPAKRQAVLAAAEAVHAPATRIGTIVAGNRLILKKCGEEIALPSLMGFDHFDRCKKKS